MPKQLTIFDVEPVVSFDPKKAHIHRLNSKLRYTDVFVQIPRQAKAIDELKPTTAPDERYELFEDYTIGIWRYKRAEDKRFVWEEAEKMCVSKQGMKKSRFQYVSICHLTKHLFQKMLCNIYRQIKKAEITLNLLRQSNYNIWE